MMMTTKKYKGTVFRMLFTDPERALSIYNALNGANYNDPAELKIVTLENAIYLNVKNDVAIMFDSSLSLFEQQSPPNLNMPLGEAIETAVGDCIRMDILKEFPGDN